MLYSVNYQSSRKRQADEIKCPVNQLGLLYKTMKEEPVKRYNIMVDNLDNKTIEQVNLVKEAVNNNYTCGVGDIRLLQVLIDSGYNAYLKFPITDWESFQVLKRAGVTDIYIDGPLGFQMEKIAQAKDNIKIRISPSISPNSALSEAPNFTSFFIRPEEIDQYDEYVDIIDFMVNNIETESALFDIYRRKYFANNLFLLIPNLNIDIDNTFMPTDFYKDRLNCGQKCKIPGYTCHICENKVAIAKMSSSLITT